MIDRYEATANSSQLHPNERQPPMKTDSQIQKDVMDELKWDPSVTHEHIGVSVNNGIVTLTGHVPTYFEKSAAEKATQRVAGVKAIAEEIEVRYAHSYSREDDDIAEAIVTAFKWNTSIPDDLLKVTVSKGWVTLSGEVHWEFQRTAAENAVKPLVGVLGVTNSITLKPMVQAIDVKAKIEQALKRAAELEADRIRVKVSGDKVTLSGNVRSFSERSDARAAAWSAPGVTKVEDTLVVAA
jgi:osmotically-inducible protein OsmY